MKDNGPAPAPGGNGLITAGLVIAALVAAGAFIAFRDDGRLDQEQAAALTDAASPPVQGRADNAPTALDDATSPDASDAAAAQHETEDAATNESADAAALDDAQTPESVAPAPQIDEVRVEGDGLLVVAGRAQPGSQVDVLIDGAVVSSVLVDASGAFAALGSVATEQTARTLTLREGTGDDARFAEEEIILAPSVRDDRPAVAEAAGADAEPDAAIETASGSDVVALASEDSATPEAIEPTAPTASNTEAAPLDETQVPPVGGDTVAVGSEPVIDADDLSPSEDADIASQEPANNTTAEIETKVAIDAAPAQDAVAPAETATAEQANEQETGQATGQREIAVLRSDREGVSLVQNSPATSVELNTIGYSNTGNVELGGRATIGSVEIRAYLNNRVVAQLPVDADGSWRGEVPDVDAGVYTLRVDAVTEDGTVASRIETPFKREEPAVLAAVTAAAATQGPVRAVTVQTGDTLWAIARERYGEGLLYVQVFEANRDAIRDPDLIFPGQVFDLPTEQ